jgi:hypothetical protein
MRPGGTPHLASFLEPRPDTQCAMNDYLVLPIDSNANLITKYLEHGGFVTLNQDSEEYSYGYGPSGMVLATSTKMISELCLQRTKGSVTDKIRRALRARGIVRRDNFWL